MDFCLWICCCVWCVEKFWRGEADLSLPVNTMLWMWINVVHVHVFCLQWSYLYLCISLAAPFLLQPVFFPLPAEKCLPLYCRYSVKANVWLAIFSFIGNYWYTHYFYAVLQVSFPVFSFWVSFLIHYSHHVSWHFYSGAVQHACPSSKRCAYCSLLRHAFLFCFLPHNV